MYFCRTSRLRGEELSDLAVLVGLEVTECQVFEFPLDLPNAEAICERREDLHRLQGDAALLFDVLESPQCAHVVEAIAKLDQHHVDVFRHREKHLPEVLRLHAVAGDLVSRGEVHWQLFELRQTVDEPGDFAAELLTNDLVGNAAVLLNIVEQGCRERVAVELELDAHESDFEWMGDVGIAGSPKLAVMTLGGEFVRLADRTETLGRKIGRSSLQYGLDVRACGDGLLCPDLQAVTSLPGG